MWFRPPSPPHQPGRGWLANRASPAAEFFISLAVLAFHFGAFSGIISDTSMSRIFTSFRGFVVPLALAAWLAGTVNSENVPGQKIRLNQSGDPALGREGFSLTRSSRRKEAPTEPGNEPEISYV